MYSDIANMQHFTLKFSLSDDARILQRCPVHHCGQICKKRLLTHSLIANDQSPNMQLFPSCSGLWV